MSRTNLRFRILLCPLALALSGASSARAEIVAEYEMDHDPKIRAVAPVKDFSDRQKPLWLQALARPEADLQRMAAEAIGRGHAAGISGMEEAIPQLVAILESPSSHPAARLAAAHTLIQLNARVSAEKMAAGAAKYGFELRRVVEPALAAWDYTPARAVWQARLTSSEVRYRDLLLAIHCLRIANARQATVDLLAIVHDGRRSPSVRSEASLAAGVLQDQGLESDARRLLAGSAPLLVERLCAVRLVARHAGDDAQRLLAQFAVDEEPAVAVVALTRLLEIDPRLVLPLAERAFENPDAKVRQCGADAYARIPDPQRVAALAELLDDPHPGVRSSIRESLYELAGRSELDGPVRSAAMAMLGGEKWRGLEQAALLLAALDHKPAAGRLVELLNFNRAEVGVAAAWSLKKLALSETLPPMLEKARRNAELSKLGQAPRGVDDQTGHLFEALGRAKFAAAEPLLREHVPKVFALGSRARSAAIWSLGLLHQGVPDETLAGQLMERIEDNGSPAELMEVKQTAAVSLGRMKTTSQLAALRKLTTPVVQGDRLGMTIRWAVIELTGEQLPEPPPRKIRVIYSFLQSLDD